MIDFLNELDTDLFLFLNSLNHPSVDGLMKLISGRFVWIPLYAYMLFVVIKNYKFRAIYIILSTVLVITLCDQFSVHFFKNVFERLRPCHNPSIMDMVHVVDNHCGGQYGFVSSHASNVFGLAFFLVHFLKRIDRQWVSFLFIWAVVVSYSRIYLGVHYPGDIVCGALLGILIAFGLLKILKFLDLKFELKIVQ